MKKYAFYMIFIILILSGCISTKQRARNLVKKGYDTIQKGLDLDPTLADSINKSITVYVTVPSDSGKQQIETVIDTTSFKSDISEYDSLIEENDRLADRIASGELEGVERENEMYRLSKINDRLNRMRGRFISGYAIDSTYVFEDSTLIASFEIKGGQFYKFEYKTKADTVSTRVDTNIINLDGRKMVGNFWEDTKFYWFIGALFLIFLILALRKIRL